MSDVPQDAQDNAVGSPENPAQPEMITRAPFGERIVNNLKQLWAKVVVRVTSFSRRAWLVMGASVLVFVSLLGAGAVAMRVEVPNLDGLSAAEAQAAVEAAGLSWDGELISWARYLDEAFQVVNRQDPSSGSVVWRGSKVDITMEPMPVVVPDLSGETYGRAAVELELLGLRIDADFEDAPGAKSWKVLSQSPAAGLESRAGEQIEVVLDLPLIAVPNLVGRTLGEADEALNRLGLLTRSDVVGAEDDWEVAGQAPPVGELIEYGDWVEVQVLPPIIEVPSVVGLGRDEAVRTLEAAGFTVQLSPESSSYDWTVASQVPGGASGAREGSAVQVTLNEPRIVFSVTGNGSRAVITWTVPGNSFSIGQDTNARVPWSMSFPMTSGYRGNLSAQMMNGSSITCTITVNGRVTQQITSTGQYAIAMCG